ncbi:ATP-binding cassette domain-containing protein [Sphingomonas sp. 1P08PE]|uniref:ATP-binding cassette domain-containing protein n=1 Tax=Sphingomonas sp. 1P08PE TaxID=554122 RepID=UPI0039A39765
MIRLSDVRKVYRTRSGDNVVLDGVGLELRRGERLGVLGRNGAGKSTMVRLISGAERPTSGRIERHMSVSWPLAFGGAFQPTLSGIDNVRFISRIYAQDFQRNLSFVADFSELGPYLHEPVRSYSSGMRARLAFAISMIIEFDCFLIDEIGAVGDARFHDRCNHELFGKRGDRAMVLISHDPGYLRDHCNRYALLHGGRLTLLDDFDEAYGRFREVIGLSAAPVVDQAAAVDRTALIEVAQHRALGDDRFRLLVREGDWHRDAGEWAVAEQRYATALALHPYQRSYWVQLGHAAKEGGHFARAELAYRTACAMGEPAADVVEHLRFVMARGGDDPAAWPIHPYYKGKSAEQVPGRPDVEALAWLLWKGVMPDDAEAAALLRRCTSCDALAAVMVAEPQFAAPHPHLHSANGLPHPEAIRILALSHLPYAEAYDLIARMADEPAWPLAAAAGAFADWPAFQKALNG